MYARDITQNVVGITMLEAMVMAVTAAEPPLHLMHVMSHDTFYVCAFAVCTQSMFIL